MHHIRLVVITSLLVAGLSSIAAEVKEKPQVVGEWTLVKMEAGQSKPSNQNAGSFAALSVGAGHKYHADGEFLVPGEERGSLRYALPLGLHFRITPTRIDKDSAVVDVLLGYTELDRKTGDGFSATTQQADGRYACEFGKPFTIKLRLPDGKSHYELQVMVDKE